VTWFRVPVGGVREADEAPDSFDPGVALARAAAQLQLGDSRSREGTVDTPWGPVEVEARDRGQVLVALPSAEAADAPVMLQAASRRMGLDASAVEATGAEMRVGDVGHPVLVAPVADEDALAAAPDEVDPSGVPGVDARSGVAYAQTQSDPYPRLVARTWGEADPLAALGAAAVHMVARGVVRPTYPRTRVMARRLGDPEDEDVEIAVDAEKTGGSSKVTRVLVGGPVEPVDG